MSEQVHLQNVQPGYAECSAGIRLGWVEQRDVRTSLDLGTGVEHKAKRWFPSVDGNSEWWRVKTGYATLAEAIKALEAQWDTWDEYDEEAGWLEE